MGFSFLTISGVTLLPQQVHILKVREDESLQITTATLNLQLSPALCMNPNSHVSVWVEVKNTEYLLCNISKAKWHANVEVMFGAGEEIKLFCRGLGVVQLTGQLEHYLDPERQRRFLWLSSEEDDDHENSGSDNAVEAEENNNQTSESTTPQIQGEVKAVKVKVEQREDIDKM